MSSNNFKTHQTLEVNGKKYHYHSLPQLEKNSGKNISRLPYSLKILLENLLRYEDGVTVTQGDIEALMNWDPKAKPDKEIQFRPTRVILQDFTGVPAVADLAAMRRAIKDLGGSPSQINPLQNADLVIDHSVQVDFFGTKDSWQKNTDLEYERNKERYQFLRWGQKAFKNFNVVPPETGIVHQVNLEFLAKVAWHSHIDQNEWVYPDTLVGTDSHTTMINGLGVVGWGVGGIEAEAAMLGQPISMLIPQVVGFRMKGKLPPGTTATDLVLTVTEMLRKKGVVGKFVEFFGPGLKNLTLADRATVSNMAPEYGATIGIFLVDEKTTEYLALTNRNDVKPLVENYYRTQKMWNDPDQPEAEYSDVLELDLSTVQPSLAGPSRPQDRVLLSRVKDEFKKAQPTLAKGEKGKNPDQKIAVKDPEGHQYSLGHGDVVIAAITSCTNTSNPAGLMAAGLLAKNAVLKGLTVKPWVKTSLAPGSKVVTDYLNASELTAALEKLKFNLVGYGCTTCIGNSGPLPDHVSKAVQEGELVVAAVLSGNRNFEGRISPQVRANYLAGPALVVAYALAGSLNCDLSKDPLGTGSDGQPVYLKDIWPSSEDVSKLVTKFVSAQMFKKSYSSVFEGDEHWKALSATASELYNWDNKSTYIKEPPFFENMPVKPAKLEDIKDARVLAYLGDSVTTDHISPAGSIAKDSPAGKYLIANGVAPKDFNSFGSRRGNHEVMMRGTFGNNRIKNKLVPSVEGGYTAHLPDGEQMSIFDASIKYQQEKTSLIVLAGKEYGTGSSRDWAAKGTLLLGVKAVIAESFERIHRSNLIGMGVLPLQFKEGDSAESLRLTGKEKFSITGLNSLQPSQMLTVTAVDQDGKARDFQTLVRIDTPNEKSYYEHGGILQYVLRQILKS